MKKISFQNAKEKGSLKFRYFTNGFRVFPSFIIAGFPRCGTTSLYNYLILHPSIVPAQRKEIRFFNQNFGIGLNWYKLFFPTSFSKYKLNNKFRKDFMAGDGSGTYVHHPLSPIRIKNSIPDVKIIILLRNPIERAYSQYYHNSKQGIESLSFEKAIENESKRIEGEWERMKKEKGDYSFKYHNFSYLSAGIYVDILKPWLETFSEKQILILGSEDMNESPQKIFNKTITFLNLLSYDFSKFERYNFYDDRPSMSNQMKKKLYEFFKPHNLRLYKFLGRNFNWEI